MPSPLRVVQFGLGPIGLLSATAALSRGSSRGMELVGAIDIDPAKAGRDLSDLPGIDRPSGIVVRDDAAAALAELRPDVVLHTTSSFLDRVMDQLVMCLEAGAHVVSSTEELAYPFERHPDLSRRLDQVAVENERVVVGTGVNPGYAMDAMALAATGICIEVRSVRVERVVDASKRRLPLQAKIGAGLTEQAFQERRATGKFGHIGLVESLYLVAHGLGWKIDRIEETLDPVLARRDVETRHMVVAAGDVAGIHHVARGFSGDEELVSLDLKMYVGAEGSTDTVIVDGDPPIRLVAEGGIFGDTATAGALINTAGIVSLAAPGLRTVAELPIPRAFGTR